MALFGDVPKDESGVAAMVDAAAAVWRRPAAEIPGFDGKKLLDTLEKLSDRAADASSVDLNVQALLALVRAAHKSWFTPQQFAEVGKWLDNVADAGAGDWQVSFGSDEEVGQSVASAMRISTLSNITITRDNSGIYVSYKDGDYGGASGKHNGKIVIDDNSVSLFNEKKPGVKITWQGTLPSTHQELKKILGDANWSESQADEDDDDDDEE
eukprot:TRINITY_DN19257_c0_g1_i1.p1 TRINITY_DN19257_c0_g1~~TRINITY_DN19257_c0_g1_i1.p1  ORF type:complete len:233 (+),score=120.89 TRINITY_DN19257_c0_g1_i1:68-700(+)